MRDVVPLTPSEAVEVALDAVDSAINAGINPNKAISVVAQRYGIDRHKVEDLYINRGRDGDGGGSGPA